MKYRQFITADILQAVAEAKLELDNIGKGEPSNIARHTGLTIKLVTKVLSDPIFEDLFGLFKKGEFRMWAGLVAQEEKELSKLVSRIGYDAIIRLKELIHSSDEKVANTAVRTALEYNADLERPAIIHEFRSRFTEEELDKARQVVRAIKESRKKIPVIADGPVN